VIESTTFEEAPATTRRWLGQRSRWLKGWMRLVKILFLSVFSRASLR
jgi:cellulose synthase/poly-beta-1,6-N-acetylglucosamine synthase-like glycosyltransferase